MSKNEQQLMTRSMLMGRLAALGVMAGDRLMLHVSVKSIGWLVGGPDILVMALLDLLGPDGSLMMYVGWEDGPYTMVGDEWTAEKRQAYLDECPGYDPRTSAEAGDGGWDLEDGNWATLEPQMKQFRHEIVRDLAFCFQALCPQQTNLSLSLLI